MHTRVPALFVLFAFACSGAAGGSSSSSSSSGAAGQRDAGPARCNGGPCESTSLLATFGPAVATLDTAYLGLEATDAGTLLYVEAYRGAAAGCPEASSPTPRQTLILSGVPVVSAGTVVTRDDGVRASLLDFNGDLFNSLAPARATSLRLTVRDIDVTTAALLVADLDVTFADGGTLRGTLAATHCASLDL